MTAQERFLYLSLRKCYDESLSPVLFVKNDFSPFYFNQKMKTLFPDYCGKDTVKKFITEESVNEFLNLKSDKELTLAALPGCPFDSFTVKPVFYGSLRICYSITIVGSFSLSKWAGVDSDKRNMVFSVPVSDISDKFKKIKETASSEISESLGEVKDIIDKVSVLSRHMEDNFEKSLRLSKYSQSYFLLSSLMKELSRISGNIVLPDGFIEKDFETAVYASKSGVADAVLHCCRFLVVESARGSKIKMEFSFSKDKVTLILWVRLLRVSENSPYSMYVTEDGIFNYGLAECRDFIDSQGGSLVIIRKSDSASLHITFPRVDVDTLPPGILDVASSEFFKGISFDVGEYRKLLETKK